MSCIHVVYFSLFTFHFCFYFVDATNNESFLCGNGVLRRMGTVTEIPIPGAGHNFMRIIFPLDTRCSWLTCLCCEMPTDTCTYMYMIARLLH